MVRNEVLSLVGLPLWLNLSKGRLEKELDEHDQLVARWKYTQLSKQLESCIEEVVDVCHDAKGGVVDDAKAKISTAQDVLKAKYKTVSKMAEAVHSQCDILRDLIEHLKSKSASSPAKKKKKSSAASETSSDGSLDIKGI